MRTSADVISRTTLLGRCFSPSLSLSNPCLLAWCVSLFQGGLGSAGLVRGGFKHKDNGLPKNGENLCSGNEGDFCLSAFAVAIVPMAVRHRSNELAGKRIKET